MLDKAVAVLNAVAKDPCGLAELCNRTGLPRATAHRLAVGLEVHRLLRRGSDGRWRPGAALAELAGGATDPLLDAASSVLPRLRDITGESVQLYRRDGMQRVCVSSAEPPSGLRDTVPIGARLPMTKPAQAPRSWPHGQTQAPNAQSWPTPSTANARSWKSAAEAGPKAWQNENQAWRQSQPQYETPQAP